LDIVTNITGIELDSSFDTLNRFPSIDSDIEERSRIGHDNSKTNVVVPVVVTVVVTVAIGRSTVLGIVVPRTTAQLNGVYPFSTD
jgi:hypothetical protein